MPKRKERESAGGNEAGAVVRHREPRPRETERGDRDKRQRREASPPEAPEASDSTAKDPPWPTVTKRASIQGKQRRLGTQATASTPKLNRISGSTRRNVTLSGNKVNFGLGTGGFEGVEKGSTGGGLKEEELWVTRKAGFAFLLKRALGAFVQRGHECSRLTLKGMGAAIPTVLTLGLAVPDQLPCGAEGIDTRVETGSTDCYDEILPQDDQGQEDENQDPQYQTRVKSTITVHLALKQSLPQPKQQQQKGKKKS